MTNTRPTASVVAVREILWDALQTVYADGHDGNVLSVDADQLARVALAASDRDVLVTEIERLRALLSEARQHVRTVDGIMEVKIDVALAALVPLGGGV